MKIEEIPISNNTVIMGVGNPDRGDDGVGAFVAEELNKKGIQRVFNCCEVPENYLSKVCSLNPDIVLIVDAVNIGELPGTIKLLKAEDVSQGITTHNAGLDILQGFIKNSCDSEVYVVAVQPEILQGNMSHRIKEAGEKIINIIEKKAEETGRALSRRCVPEGIDIPFSDSVLASGGSENISFCFTKENRAYLSQHFGNIEEVRTREIYRDNIIKCKNIWNYEPRMLGCDQHPGYGSTFIFEELAQEWNLPLLKIQHHHAHLAGCAADNNIKGKVIGVAFDGMGYGEGGQLWGGEFMVFDFNEYKRLGFLKPHLLPGGDIASKEPWRMALSYLIYAEEDYRKLTYLNKKKEALAVEKMIKEKINSLYTSSAGRLFDAVAAILGIVDVNTFSARGPIDLQNLVKKEYLKKGYSFKVNEKDGKFEIDTSILIREIMADMERGVEKSKIASKFHYTVAKIVVEGISRMKDMTGIDKACISGGVFCNYYVPEMIVEMAREKGIEVLTHHKISPGDNGLSYGQAVIAGSASCV